MEQGSDLIRPEADIEVEPIKPTRAERIVEGEFSGKFWPTVRRFFRGGSQGSRPYEQALRDVGDLKEYRAQQSVSDTASNEPKT